MMLQKKLNASCVPKSCKLRIRALDGGARQMRAALKPIKRNKIPQTIGNTILGGDKGGCVAVSL